MSTETPLAEVRGSGPSGEGGYHWGLERAVSVATLALLVWFLVSLWRLPTLDHTTVTGWLGDPLVATPMLLFVVSVFWHLKMGLVVVIEDYVHETGNRLLALTLVNFAAIFAGALAVIAVLKIALDGNA